MSQELFGEASKHRNKKQEEKRQLNRKIGRKIFDDKLHTINLPVSKKTKQKTLEMGQGDDPLPSIYFTLSRR